MSLPLPLPEVDSIKTWFSPLTCVERGFHNVAPAGKPPHHLYYELHGSKAPDAVRLVFIMGLNNSSFGWWHQLAYFASLKSPAYSVLVFDNRGVGMSDSPRGRWTTKDMAADTVRLMDLVWGEEENRLNVVGISMGGMIAQELALAIPHRLATLVLTSTQTGSHFSLPTRTSVELFAKLLTNTAGGPAQIIALVVASLFPAAWLDTEVDGEKTRTRMEKEYMDRAKITRLQTGRGKVGQMGAVLTHKATASRLAGLASQIPKIGIIVGDEDALIPYHRSLELHDMIPGSELKVVQGGGHALTAQIPDEYNAWVEGVIREGMARVLQRDASTT